METTVNSQVGTEWRDSAGHSFVVSREETDEHGKVRLYGDLVCDENTSCVDWWRQMHNAYDDFPDYHSDPKVVADAAEVADGYVFGWRRLNPTACGATHPENEGRDWCGLPAGHDVFVSPSGVTYSHVVFPDAVVFEDDEDDVFGW